MEEKMLAYFSAVRPLSNEEREAILEGLTIREFEKGTVLLKDGQRSFTNYFVLQGCVRKYYLKEGEEKISNFYTEDQWILPALGAPANDVADYYLECTETCTLMVADEREGNELLQKMPQFQELSMVILEKEVMRQQQDLANYQNSSPEEKYLRLQKERPDLLERIPQYQLSSYIGVKPESLSRIRKRMADKRNS